MSAPWSGQSIAGTVKLPTADEGRGLGTGEVDYDLTWILTLPILPKWSAHVNVGYTWIGSGDDPDLGDLLH